MRRWGRGIDLERSRRRLALLLALVVLPALPLRAADESVLLEEPPTKTVEDPGALERAYEEEEPTTQPVLLPRAKRALEDLPAFLRDTELAVDMRFYYFRRRLGDGRDVEALALGGTAAYRSGWLFDRIRAGLSLMTSQKLYAPGNRDGTGLLRPGQKSFTVLGEAFLRLRQWDNELTFYRQSLELPYLNGNDSRMVPNTFLGATLRGRVGKVGYTAGYLDEIKPRNENRFISFSEVAGVQTGGNEKGLTFAGIQLFLTEHLSVGGINQYVPDTLNTAYAALEWFRELPGGWGLRLGGQFTHQRSVGDDRLTGDSFDTWVAGAKVAASFADAVLSVGFSVSDDDERIRNPFGSYPGYLGMMLRNFNAANEKAWGLSASTYFDFVGLPDLSLALRYTEGYDARFVLTGEHLGDQREFNSTLDYRVSQGWLRGLWLRARFGWGETDADRRDTLEARVVLRYDFQFL